MRRLDVEAFIEFNPYRTRTGAGSSEVTTILRATELILRHFNEKHRVPTPAHEVINLAQRINFTT